MRTSRRTNTTASGVYESEIRVNRAPRGLLDRRTHPAEGNEFALFRDLQDELFFVHSTRVARRMLLRYQKYRHDVLSFALTPKQ